MAAKHAQNTSEILATFILQVRPGDIPSKIRDIAKLHVLDGFATMVGGVDEKASRLIQRHLSAAGAKQECSVVGTRIQLPAQQAALANGVHGHVLDFDDAQLATLASRPLGQQTHPTSPVLAATLALAEKLGASLAAFLTAYIVGVEVACRLADAVEPSHYLDGFHATGTLGTFGATAAAAHLLRLDAKRVGAALGIAGTLSSGLRANRGTMAKALNAGRAAENGVFAAMLAEAGFTGSRNIFEDPMGFFRAACRNGVDRSLLRFGRPYFLSDPGIAVKLYPCAGVLHPALDVVLDLVSRHNIGPSQVRRIKVTMNATAALPLVYDRPSDGLQAKFSLPFAVAVAVIDRKAGLPQFTTRRVSDRKVRLLMSRVELSRSTGQSSGSTEVEIGLKNGQSYSGRAAIARGHPKLPASRVEVEDKFRSCAGTVLTTGEIAKFLRRFWSTEGSQSLGVWLRWLRPASA